MTDSAHQPSNKNFKTRRRIVVTRTEEQSASVASGLEELGAEVLIVPTIRIVPAEVSEADRAVLNRFHEYDYAFFTSVNAVTNFFRIFSPDSSRRHRPVIVAIGSKTRSTIQEFGFNADIVPEKFHAGELLNSLASVDLRGKRALVPKGNLSNSEIADFVRANGGSVDEVVVYMTMPNDSLDESVKREIRSGRFDTIVFFSPSQVKNFLSVFGKSVLGGKQIAAIGPTTKKAAERQGLVVDVVPENSTIEELITSLLDHEEI